MKAARVIAALGLTVGLVNACMMVDPEPNAPRVTNFTEDPIELFIDRDGVRTPLGAVNGDTTVHLDEFTGTCTDGTLVAIGTGGEEVDRRPEPLCTDEAWSVGR